MDENEIETCCENGAMGLTLQVTVGSTSTPSTNTVHPGVNDMDWFAGVAEEELLYYTGVGNDVDSLWAVIGSFVPPPPRPPYLPEEGVTTDGLTTCDLCSWAWRNDRHSFSLDGTLGKWRHWFPSNFPSSARYSGRTCKVETYTEGATFHPVLIKILCPTVFFRVISAR